MKALLLTAITFLTYTNSWCQEEEKRFVRIDVPEFALGVNEQGGSPAPEPSRSVFFEAGNSDSSRVVSGLERAKWGTEAVEFTKCCNGVDEIDVGTDESGFEPAERGAMKKIIEATPAKPDDAIDPKEKFHWKPALAQSMAFLAMKHSFRIVFQEKTRREFAGPFFRDWGRSVKNLRGWSDGDNLATNYVLHPMQGAFTGRIFVNNSDNAKKQEFGAKKQYWRSRGKALVWSAVWSTQFELGPISEATIGNVGLHVKDGRSIMTYGDLVVTPVVGTAFLVGEDAIDKYILKNWLEKKSSNKFKIRLLRSLLTPTTSLSNLIRGKVPWKRDHRPL